MEDTSGTFDSFITRMQKLLADEDNSLWSQGDLLLDQRLDADGMRKAAELLDRSTSVLRERERISREFKVTNTAVPRVTGVAWTVYRELSKVKDPAARKEVWEQRPAAEWTLEAMRRAVADRLPTPGSSRKMRTFTFEGYRLVVNVVPDGITIETTCNNADITKADEHKLDSRRRFVGYTKVGKAA